MDILYSCAFIKPRYATVKGRGNRYFSYVKCMRKCLSKCSSISAENKLPPLRQMNNTRSLRMGLPSKGRMAEETLQLLHDCQLSVKKINPRQYAARIPEIPEIEVWFQRASDVVRKVRDGTFDFGIAGYDMVVEYGEGDSNLLVLHDALNFGACKLAFGIPNSWNDVNSLDDILALATLDRPLRILTGYQHLTKTFLATKGFSNYSLLYADGALEAGPAMGEADVIVDLVSSGVTLRENNLKEVTGGTLLQSEGVLIANKNSLKERIGIDRISHEIIERLEARIRADQHFTITANIRGSSEENVADKVLNLPALTGLQGPTISRVYPNYESSNGEMNWYSVSVCVTKQQMYPGIKQLREIGGSGVLVSPLTYIFDEEPTRWMNLAYTMGWNSKLQ